MCALDSGGTPCEACEVSFKHASRWLVVCAHRNAFRVTKILFYYCQWLISECLEAYTFFSCEDDADL